MTDIQEIYSILLARNFQEELFSDLPGKKKEGRDTRAGCPFCQNKDGFSYNSQRPVWRCWSCNKGGDWISYLEQTKGYAFQQAKQELANKAGVETSPQEKAYYQAYTKRADLLEDAQDYFSKRLDMTGSPVFDYLTARGYSAEDIYGMELGEYTDRKALQAQLKSKGYADQQIRDSGLLTIGESWPLTFLWKDQAGRAIGIGGRAILPDIKPKYKYSAGLQKDQGLIGFSSVRGSSRVIVLEGVLDALYLNHKGFKAVAVGGSSLSADQLKSLEAVGTKELLLSMDMDKAGQDATERILRDLRTSRLRAYVVSLPAGFKDPDELIRGLGEEVFQRALDNAEKASSWMAKRIVDRHDLSTDRGLDQALEEAGDHYSDIKDLIDAKAFMDSLQKATGLSKEELDSRLQQISKTASARRSQAILESRIRDIQQKASQGDISGAEADLAKALRESRASRGVEPPKPYLLEDLTRDLSRTPPAMSSGYSWLDSIAKIPVGALTIVAGRPRQGKTTFQLNLLVNMLRIHKDKRFYFFSYEEAKKAIATKIIMILAGVEIQRDTNYGAYINYLKERRALNSKADYSKIDRALQEYEAFTSEGRLLISDDMFGIEDLATVIDLQSREGDTGAVFIDYIQKIPAPIQSQRYLDIKLISEILLRQAVSRDIPIILGAQLNRASGGGAEPSLADLREGGDIEQDANLVLSLYTKALDELQEKASSSQRGMPHIVEMKVSVLKNRGGTPSLYEKMDWNMPIYKITEQEKL